MISAQEALKPFLFNFITEGVRYLLFAGIAYSVCWVLLRQRLFHRMIQRKYSTRKRITSEFLHSISSIAIFSLIGIGVYIGMKNGYGRSYAHISDRGWAYFFLSIVLAIVIHDAWFYFTHRLMHHPALFRHVHLVHHQSTNPSPWAAYSFHPFEAFIQGLIGPILIFLLPLHIYALLAFSIFQITYNVMGHSSLEILPKGFTRSILFWHNTVTHHNMHHKYFNCHYSIYFNWWDRIFGTMHPHYDSTFEEVTGRERETAPSPSMQLAEAE